MSFLIFTLCLQEAIGVKLERGRVSFSLLKKLTVNICAVIEGNSSI